MTNEKGVIFIEPIPETFEVLKKNLNKCNKEFGKFSLYYLASYKLRFSNKYQFYIHGNYST